MESILEFDDKFKDRFWSKVNINPSGCWEWIGALRNGYGAIKYLGKTYSSHRVSWMMHNGSIDEGKIVCHKCDNRVCVNPNHLFLGTYSDNTLDAVKKGKIIPPLNETKVIVKGENVGTSKLSKEDVENIRNEYREGKISQRELASKYRVSHRQIGRIVRKEHWNYL